uniref:DNA (cytosine-5-)-methyltransferase n=1 Tax=Poecilia reticulata TaxID=8081 RepID=A0A3P9Q543_POERE
MTLFQIIPFLSKELLTLNTFLSCFIAIICKENNSEPEDIMAVVTDRPYSVYLYVGVELGAGRSASVLLIGYFDEHSCRSVVKLLHTLQMSTDSADPRQPMDTDVMARVADSDAWLLVEVLRKYELPLSNLVAFYCSAPQPSLSRVFVSQLQAFSPKLLSLCSIPGIAERTCQAGLTAAFSHAVDLITDVHRHYSICPSINGSLTEVFADTGPHLPQYLLLAHSVQKMAARWQDLQEYFKSLNEAEASIRSRLLDDAVRLQFLFLSHALEPLRALNKLQQGGTAELSMELQLTSILMESYTASICRPVTKYCDKSLLLQRELDLLHGDELLPVAEVNVGTRASDFMLAFGPSVGEQNLARFLRDAQAFYRAALQSLVESIPGPLGDVTLRNIGLMLKSPESITILDGAIKWLEVPVMPVLACRGSWSGVRSRVSPRGPASSSLLKTRSIFLRRGWWSGTARECALRSVFPLRSYRLVVFLQMVKRPPCCLRLQVSLQSLKPFAAFSQYFCANSFATLVTYREAVLSSLQEAAMRCGKKFSPLLQDSEEVLKQVLDWAFGGFQPTGPEGLKPKRGPSCSTNCRALPEIRPPAPKPTGKPDRVLLEKGPNLQLPTAGSRERKDPRWRRTSLCSQREFICRSVNSVSRLPAVSPADFCLCCGTKEIEISHPLFKGSLCLKCKDNFTETLYRYDDDGYQSYCTICCYGMEVILCGHDGCHRSFCEDCLNILVGPRTFDSLKVVDPWICYLCQPHQPHGALVPREDWRFRIQEMFANNSAMEFEPHRVYPSVPTAMRRPLRVLSLFDGIGTGYLVLKELGFKVEKYVASEVCEDSVAVATINHDAKIVHVGDVRFLEKWGPFDLLIGGSPCNDLSIVNPLRKGLYEGTGRLFFEFYRILQLLKPKGDDERPFFWLFENVVFMNTHDKVNICRFLECNPVMVDAVKVSPAHRARYFWGNIPGMSRPIIASQNDKLNLQDCLELGREARVTKVRTITTNPNSLKQGKDVSLLPVLQNGREDILWITELEKIFGFPKHYTDARNMNRQQRQKLLGKAWSVPVIRHLFAPLKEYFACDETDPAKISQNYGEKLTL